MHPKAEQEFDRQAGILLSKVLLLMVGIFFGTIFTAFLLEIRHHPGGRWSKSEIHLKVLRYSESKLKKTASGWGATQATLDSAFGGIPR